MVKSGIEIACCANRRQRCSRCLLGKILLTHTSGIFSFFSKLPRQKLPLELYLLSEIHG